MSAILTIAEAAQRIAAKKLSPVELAKTHLDRIRSSIRSSTPSCW